MQRRTTRGLVTVQARARPPEIDAPARPDGYRWQPNRPLADASRRPLDPRAAAENATITVMDYIGDDGVSDTRVAAALRSIGDRPITVEINSPGGDYFQGVAIYNLLRRHSKPIKVQVLGIAASAASVIAMAGDLIEMAHNAEMMVHNSSGLVIGNRHDMLETAALLERLDLAMARTYAARSTLSEEEAMAMMDEETFISAEEAINMGLADAVMERQAERLVYAEGPDFPRTIRELDQFLARQGMPRVERRNLMADLRRQHPPTPAEPVRDQAPAAAHVAGPATQDAGATQLQAAAQALMFEMLARSAIDNLTRT